MSTAEVIDPKARTWITRWTVRGRGRSVVVPVEMLMEIPEEAFEIALNDKRVVKTDTHYMFGTDTTPRLCIRYACPPRLLLDRRPGRRRYYYAQNMALPHTRSEPAPVRAEAGRRTPARAQVWKDRRWWKLWRFFHGF